MACKSPCSALSKSGQRAPFVSAPFVSVLHSSARSIRQRVRFVSAFDSSARSIGQICGVNLENYVRVARFAGITDRFLADIDAAELLHRLARAPIADPDLEGHPIDEFEGVIQHEGLQRQIVMTSPPAAGDEGVADFDLALGFIMIAVPGTANQLAVLVVDHPKGAARFHRALEKIFEHRTLIAIAAGVLFPDQRIRGHGIQALEVARLQRLQPDQIILYARLKLNTHGPSLITEPVVNLGIDLSWSIVVPSAEAAAVV